MWRQKVLAERRRYKQAASFHSHQGTFKFLITFSPLSLHHAGKLFTRADLSPTQKTMHIEGQRIDAKCYKNPASDVAYVQSTFIHIENYTPLLDHYQSFIYLDLKLTFIIIIVNVCSSNILVLCCIHLQVPTFSPRLMF